MDFRFDKTQLTKINKDINFHMNEIHELNSAKEDLIYNYGEFLSENLFYLKEQHYPLFEDVKSINSNMLGAEMSLSIRMNNNTRLSAEALYCFEKITNLTFYNMVDGVYVFR